MIHNRRTFLNKSLRTSAGIVLLPQLFAACQSTDQGGREESQTGEAAELFFRISLAEWSLNKSIKSGEVSNLDFPKIAREKFGLDAVEYVNQLFMDKAEDMAYLTELKTITEGLGVKNLLIMIDNEGHLGNTDDAKRIEAVENHYKWVEAAKFLGCHSVRVNAAGEGTREEVAAAAADGLGRLTEFASERGLNVIVENHGGYSSDGEWLSGVMKQVNSDRCGTLPDFGNFIVDREAGLEYDRYKGVGELMPFAKGVSAKANEFDAEGNDTQTDYVKMLSIVKEAGYRGYIGIEYEGDVLSEMEGIQATLDLLKRAGGKVG